MKNQRIPFLTWFGIGFTGMFILNGNNDLALCGVVIIWITLLVWAFKGGE